MRIRDSFHIIVLVITIVSSVISIGLTFYVRGRQVMEQHIDLRLASFSAIAAESITQQDMDGIQGTDFLDTGTFFDLAFMFERMRNSVPNVREATLLRFTDVPGVFEYVVGSRNIYSPKELDINNDGTISKEEDVFLPGDLVYVKGINTADVHSFDKPVVSRPLYGYSSNDTIVGYAPVRSKNGQMLGVVSFTMDPDEYKEVALSIATPLVLLLVIVFALFLGGYVGLFLWRHRTLVIENEDRKRMANQALASHQLAVPLLSFKRFIADEEKLDELGANTKELRYAYDRIDRISDSLRGLYDFQSADIVQSKDAGRSLRTFIEDICKQESYKLEATNQTIDVSIEDPLRIAFEPALISGVLREIIDNFFYFAGENTSLIITAKKHASTVEITCADSGRGIDAQTQKNLFATFTRGKDAQKLHPFGLGLGLHIVKGVLDVIGGSVSIESSENNGTSITMILPYEKA